MYRKFSRLPWAASELITTTNGGSTPFSEDTEAATIDISAVNDVPTFTASEDPDPVDEDAGAVSVTAWASYNPGGGADEVSQSATYKSRMLSSSC